MQLGANYQSGKCEFSLWAPFLKDVQVKILTPSVRLIAMTSGEGGYWRTETDAAPGTNYVYCSPEFTDKPDPATHYQPEGVHGPSQIIDHHYFRWNDRSWKGLPLAEMIIYELHVGTFTPEGTFAAALPRLKELRELGITAIEIMPVAQFPGQRNWGYDGVDLFAVQNSYGGPEGLKTFVNECHRHGLAVILDVVYNHFGPEGNYLRCFGPYFTRKYCTPWGEAINYDDHYSDDVREFFIQNALYWLKYFHIDALRLDAIHAICDFSAEPFLKQLAQRVKAYEKESGRRLYLIAESDLNDSRIIRPEKEGGYGLPAQWSDDLHHCVHTLLTGERQGYYEDFGEIAQLKKSLEQGYIYDWKYSPYRKRHHGNSPKGLTPDQFVVFSQNHDQVGNRMLGDRLTTLVSFDALKLAAGSVLLSLNIPLLFMGEEYGEEHPFLYFVHHGDSDLINAVREGRKSDFRGFAWKGEPPDPQSEETFRRSQLDWNRRDQAGHKILREFYKELIHLRKSLDIFRKVSAVNQKVAIIGDRQLLVHYKKGGEQLIWLGNYSDLEAVCRAPFPAGKWKKQIDSIDSKWHGRETTLPDIIFPSKKLNLKPFQFAVYLK